MKRTKLSALVTILSVAVSMVALPLLGAHVAQECAAVDCGVFFGVVGYFAVLALAPTGIGGAIAGAVFAA